MAEKKPISLRPASCSHAYQLMQSFFGPRSAGSVSKPAKERVLSSEDVGGRRPEFDGGRRRHHNTAGAGRGGGAGLGAGIPVAGGRVGGGASGGGLDSRAGIGSPSQATGSATAGGSGGGGASAGVRSGGVPASAAAGAELTAESFAIGTDEGKANDGASGRSGGSGQDRRRHVYSIEYLKTFQRRCTEIPAEMERIPLVFVEDLDELMCMTPDEGMRFLASGELPSQGDGHEDSSAAPFNRPLGVGGKWGSPNDVPLRPAPAGRGAVVPPARPFHSTQQTPPQGGLGAPLRRRNDAWLPPSQRHNRFDQSSGALQQRLHEVTGMLNKLTLENFDSLSKKLLRSIGNHAEMIRKCAERVHFKAICEPKFAEMYATLCQQLNEQCPQLVISGEKVSFRAHLLSMCQQHFKLTLSYPDTLTDETDRELYELKWRKRKVGNVRFLGELFKKKLLSEKIVHGVLAALLQNRVDPPELDIEMLCELMGVVGGKIDQNQRAAEYMSRYFERIRSLSTNENLTIRLRFMLRDLLELRESNWTPRRASEGPKTIREIHQDAVQEDQRAAFQSQMAMMSGRGGRGGGGGGGGGGRGAGGQRGPGGRPLGLGGGRGGTGDWSGRHDRGPPAVLGGVPGGFGAGGAPRGSLGHTAVSSRGGSTAFGGMRGSPGIVGGGARGAPMRGVPMRGAAMRGAAGPYGSGRGGAAHGQPRAAVAELSEEQFESLAMDTLEEFWVAHEKDEVGQFLRERGGMKFGHLFIRIGVVEAVQKGVSERQLMLDVFVSLYENGVLTPKSFSRGLAAVVEDLDDLVLDVPHAQKHVAWFIAGLLQRGCIVSPGSVFNNVSRDLPAGIEDDVQEELAKE